MAQIGQIQINVYDKSLNFVGIIEDYESSGFTRSWYEAGVWSITINKNINNSALLQAEYYVQFGDDPRDSGKITCVTNNIDENGKGGQKLIVTGKDLRAIFAQRLVMDMNDVDAYTLTAPGETVIKTLVSSQCGATCADPKRVIPNLVIATDQGRGLSYTLSCKYTQVYAECATAATQSLIGWYVYLDHENKTFVLDCETGIDRSYGQTVNPYCLFSPDMDSLKSATLKQDISSFRNLVYVGGDGTGADRNIYTGFNTMEPTGIDRYELFDNASSLSTTAAMSTEAQNILAQYNQTYELSGAILVKSPYVYKTDYNVGDLCTVRFNDIELNIRILSITQSWSSGKYDIASVWGKPIRGLSDQVSAINTSAISNGGTSEAGTNVSGMKSGIKTYDLSSADATMNGFECAYNIIELAGTLTANRTFNFYLDATRLYGRKAYKVLVSAIGNTTNRTITLSSSGTNDITITVGTSGTTEIHDIYVDDSGNVFAGSEEKYSTVSDIGRLTEISGDGLSTQYLHDKSGNVIWTNNGLTVVDGYRGKGLLCNGSSYAIANSSVIGSTGTISIQFSASSVSSGILWTDSVIATSGNTLYLSSGSLYINHHYSSSSESALIYSINTNTLYSVVVQFISSTSLLVIVNNIEYPIIWTIPSVSPTNNLYIAVNTALNTFFNGTIYGLKISSRLWTRDECISWGNNIAGVESSNAVFALNTTTGEKIYTKIINGTTSASVGGSVTVAHGLDITKILPFSGFIRYSTSQILPFGTRSTLTDDANCVSAYISSSTLITITNTTGLAAVYRGAPFTILIPYML